MRNKDFNIHVFIQELQGTCNSIDEQLSNYDMEQEDLNDDDFETIDNEIFLCETCGWWYEIFEQSEGDETQCNDCNGE